MTLKWKAENGAVAAPATSEVIAQAITGRTKRQRGSVWSRRHQPCRRSASKEAISAMVAAKDIWKPGLHQALGRQREHDQRRQRHRAQGERGAVDAAPRPGRRRS